MAGRPRTRPAKPPETVLQAIFIKRVKEELGNISVTELSTRPGAPPQRTLNDVINGGVVPGLTVVAGIAAALGVHPWQLMQDKASKSQENLTNVRRLPDRYPSIFAAQQEGRTKSKARRRNTSK